MSRRHQPRRGSFYVAKHPLTFCDEIRLKYFKHFRSLGEDLALASANLKKTKKILTKMPVAVRAEYTARKRQKELERTLLPDAPPRKRARYGNSSKFKSQT